MFELAATVTKNLVDIYDIFSWSLKLASDPDKTHISHSSSCSIRTSNICLCYIFGKCILNVSWLIFHRGFPPWNRFHEITGHNKAEVSVVYNQYNMNCSLSSIECFTFSFTIIVTTIKKQAILIIQHFSGIIVHERFSCWNDVTRSFCLTVILLTTYSGDLTSP
jgi:hypothetical protein